MDEKKQKPLPTLETVPDETLFYIADNDISVDQTIYSLYEQPDRKTIDHFKNVNEHLSKGQVKTGQMVIITPPDPVSCQRSESIMMEAAAVVDEELQTQTARERRILANRYAFINDYGEIAGTVLGQSSNYYKTKVKRVEGVLKSIERLYMDSYNSGGLQRNNRFYEQRRAYFVQLNSALNGLVAREMFGPNAQSTKIKKSLGLSTRSIVHQWNQQGGAQSIDAFRDHYKKAKSTSRKLGRLGYASIALDVGTSAATIHRACTIGSEKMSCKHAATVEPIKTGLGLGAGALGGAGGTYLACNLVGIWWSGGTSLLWCGIVGTAVGSYGGAELGKHAGGALGDKIYDTYVK